MTLDAKAAEWTAEIRSWLLGRIAKNRDTREIARTDSAELPRRIELWWILEGKRYGLLEGALSSDWSLVDHLIRRLLATYNPVWRPLAAPEGETDWVATAFVTATSSRPAYVSKATRSGLGDAERSALTGWIAWITRCWIDYTADVGAPRGATETLPWQGKFETPLRFEKQQLRRWAHTAKRSRWPLLRTVVAESLRCVLEPHELDQLPLPSDRATLFELFCMVRILDSLDQHPSFVRWLGPGDRNCVHLPGLTYHFQHSLDKDQVLATGEYGGGLREGMIRHGLRTPKFVDGWLVFEEPRAGFAGVLVEAKSGAQGPEEAVYQLKAYRAALRPAVRDPLLVWGITESEFRSPVSLADDARDLTSDHWVFSSASDIGAVLLALGLTNQEAKLADRRKESRRPDLPHIADVV